MSQKTKERIRLVYGSILLALILAVGVCLALSCLSIYRSGDSPFTPARIAEHFSRIAVLTYVCIGAVIGGGVLSWVLPIDGGKVKPRREASVTLRKLSTRLDMCACEENVRASMRREQRYRRVTTITVGILSVLTMLPALIWCVNPNHFSIENLNGDIMTAVAFLLPCAVVALGMWVAAVLLCEASMSRETALVKAALVSGAGQNNPCDPQKALRYEKKLSSDPRILTSIRGVILAVGILFIVLGILNGGMADVLGKAIRICTECIGLG